MDIETFRLTIDALGAELTPTMMQATGGLCGEALSAPSTGVEVSRDHRYGPHDRNRLDLFSQGHETGKPVLLFVHGGGFIMGDKTSEGSPFYDNIGNWAAANGLLGATMTYRLAPADPHPAGTEDVLAAVCWLKANAAAHGGDPARIYVMGQSAGASHVAAFVAEGDEAVAGALLVSCIFDVGAAPPSPFHEAYYGPDHADYARFGTTSGLIASPVPLLVTVSEFDAQQFQHQAGQFAADWTAAKGTFPRLHWLRGHNHLSPAQAIGGSVDSLGPLIRDFIADTSE